MIVVLVKSAVVIRRRQYYMSCQPVNTVARDTWHETVKHVSKLLYTPIGP